MEVKIIFGIASLVGVVVLCALAAWYFLLRKPEEDDTDDPETAAIKARIFGSEPNPETDEVEAAQIRAAVACQLAAAATTEIRAAKKTEKAAGMTTAAEEKMTAALGKRQARLSLQGDLDKKEAELATKRADKKTAADQKDMERRAARQNAEITLEKEREDAKRRQSISDEVLETTRLVNKLKRQEAEKTVTRRKMSPAMVAVFYFLGFLLVGFTIIIATKGI